MRKLIYYILGKTVLRNGVERKINSQSLRLPASVYKYYPEQYELEKYDFLRKWVRPGSTVIDIGAHIGLFTVFLAHMVGNKGKVLSFEPSSENFSILKETIRLNSLDAVCDARCEAVDATSGPKKLYLSGNFASNANSLSAGAGESAQFETITTVHLDAPRFHDYKVSAVKIDAEGAEVGIFRGGKNFFKRNLPACTVEIHPEQIAGNGDRLEELIEIAEGLGYRFYFNNEPVDNAWLLSRTSCFEVQMLPAISEAKGI